MNLNKLFLDYCKDKNLEINESQVNVLKLINEFYNSNFKSFSLLKFFFKKIKKTGFYLQGDVGVGKTMILNFFFEKFDKSKRRLHFNEFMITIMILFFKIKIIKK